MLHKEYKNLRYKIDEDHFYQDMPLQLVESVSYANSLAKPTEYILAGNIYKKFLL